MISFKKEHVSNAIRVDGQIIRWEMVGPNTGVRQFDETVDAPTIAVLNGFADRRKMGVVRISGQIYDALKKKLPVTKSPPLPGGFGPNAPVRVVDKEAVLLRAGKKSPPPPAAAAVTSPPVVEASPPPPNTPIPPAPHPSPAPIAKSFAESKLSQPTVSLPPLQQQEQRPDGTSPPPKNISVAATGEDPKPPKAPKPPKRTMAKKSVVEAASETTSQSGGSGA